MSYRRPVAPIQRKRRQESIGAALSAIPIRRALAANLRRTTADALAHESEYIQYQDWYEATHVDLLSIADDEHVSPRTAIGIFAALSVGTEIERNRRLTLDMLRSGDCAHAFGADPIDKARRILDGADPTTVLGGHKVRSFYRNLLYPHRPGPVTIDRHAIAILFDAPLTDQARKIVDRIGVYQYFAGIYRHEARAQGFMPHELQAITWTYWRDHHQYGATTNIEEF